MGDRLATIDTAEKWGLCSFLGGSWVPHLTQCRLHRGLPSYQVASWSTQPFGYNRHGPKIEGCAPLGELGPHNTMWPGRGILCLSPCQVSSWSTQPFSHNTPTSQTGQTARIDRKENGPVAYRANRFTNGRPVMSANEVATPVGPIGYT